MYEVFVRRYAVSEFAPILVLRVHVMEPKRLVAPEKSSVELPVITVLTFCLFNTFRYSIVCLKHILNHIVDAMVPNVRVPSFILHGVVRTPSATVTLAFEAEAPQATSREEPVAGRPGRQSCRSDRMLPDLQVLCCFRTGGQFDAQVDARVVLRR